MPEIPMVQLGNAFSVRSDSVHTVLSCRRDATVRLSAGTNVLGETLFFVEDTTTRWLLAVEVDETEAGLERLGFPRPMVRNAIAADLAADPTSRAYVAEMLGRLPEPESIG